MAIEEPKYEIKSVHSVRGMEARTRAKWEKEGWEFVDQNQELLRTKLTFRRVKPKLPVRLLAAVSGVLVLLVIAGIILGATHGGSAAAAATASATNAAVVASEKATPTPSKAPQTGLPARPTPTAAPPERNLTVKSNADLAALLAAPEPSQQQQADFAAKYQGRTIEFDGNFADWQNDGNYKTRYDALVAPGDYSTTDQVGPAFQFKNVGMYDLHLTGNVPDYIGRGTNVHVVATVGDYNSRANLFYLEPVSTEVR